MKSYRFMNGLKIGAFALLIIQQALSCQQNKSSPNLTKSDLVKDSVSNMMANISRDISGNGPAAWLNYFEDTTHFFMASDGQLVFKDHQSAKSFIQDTLVKSIRHIDLRWSNLRIDLLTPRLAAIGANFQEDLTDAAGRVVALDGYFTGLAEQTNPGWRLRNAHWSIVK